MRKVDEQEYKLFCLRREQDGGCLAQYDHDTGKETRVDHNDEVIAYASWKDGRADYYINDGSFACAQLPRWQPIDSAPRDGTAIWVATAYSGHGTGAMEPVRPFRRFARSDAWANIYSGNQIEFTPTHWQPLPSPPTPGDPQ